MPAIREKKITGQKPLSRPQLSLRHTGVLARPWTPALTFSIREAAIETKNLPISNGEPHLDPETGEAFAIPGTPSWSKVQRLNDDDALVTIDLSEAARSGVDISALICELLLDGYEEYEEVTSGPARTAVLRKEVKNETVPSSGPFRIRR